MERDLLPGRRRGSKPMSSSAMLSATRKPCAGSRRSSRDRLRLRLGWGPADPNFRVFDNWIHEPAYLAGLMAGGLTKSNMIGSVAALPVAGGEPNGQRLHLGRQGDQSKVKSRSPSSTAGSIRLRRKEAALAQIAAEASTPSYAERFGRDRGRQAEEHHRLREHVRPEVDRAAERRLRALSGT